MRIEGELAARWSAVRLDSFTAVEGNGKLLSADDQTGEVRWEDRTGEARVVTLGLHAIRLIEARPRRIA